MMKIGRVLSGLLLMLATGSAWVYADAVSEEQDKLDQYYQRYEYGVSELEDVENELFLFEAKLGRAKKQLETAAQELLDAKSKNTDARIALAGEKNQDNERAVRLTEHSLAMAERGLRNRDKRLAWTQQQLQELLDKKDALTTQIAQAEAAIKTQERKLEQVTAQQLQKQSQEKALQQEQQALENEQKLAEVEVLTQVTAVVPEGTANTVESNALALDSQAVQVAPAPVKGADNVSNVPSKEQTIPVALEQQSQQQKSEPKLSKLDQQALEYTRKQMERFERLVHDDRSNPLYRNLFIETVDSDDINALPMEHKGRDQYWAEAKVSKGKHTFKVHKFTFSRVIPAADNGETYVFIFDSKRASRPRLVMFKKSLLDFL